MNSDELQDTGEYPTPTADPSRPARRRWATVRADLAGLSDRGKVRPNNEDHFLIVRFGRFLEAIGTNLPSDVAPPDHLEVGYGLVVADGMGGMAAGEVASRTAIALLIERALETPDWILLPDEELMDVVADRFARRFQEVNEAVVERARGDGLAEMGTTLTLALNLGPELLVAHIGDSRAYLLRDGELRRLTRDHTVEQELADLGRLPHADLLSRLFRNALTRAIGIRGGGGEPEVRRHRLADGDRLLLCTDGLTGMVDEATIEAEMGRHDAPAEACRALVDLALEGGGRDNVTVVVGGYRVEGPDDAEGGG